MKRPRIGFGRARRRWRQGRQTTSPSQDCMHPVSGGPFNVPPRKFAPACRRTFPWFGARIFQLAAGRVSAQWSEIASTIQQKTDFARRSENLPVHRYRTWTRLTYCRKGGRYTRSTTNPASRVDDVVRESKESYMSMTVLLQFSRTNASERPRSNWQVTPYTCQ